MGFIVRCNIMSLQNHHYLTVGQMIATIIVQGGERPCLFTQSVCDYFCMGLEASNPGIDEIPDYTIRNDLNTVKYIVNDMIHNFKVKHYISHFYVNSPLLVFFNGLKGVVALSDISIKYISMFGNFYFFLDIQLEHQRRASVHFE